MVWAKGANFVTTDTRMSQVGDAYSLASSFGNDFSKMLVTGKTPFKGLPKLPSYQKLKSNLGGKPKYPACERFGRDPGLIDFAASQVGLPPSWTDKPLRQQVQVNLRKKRVYQIRRPPNTRLQSGASLGADV